MNSIVFLMNISLDKSLVNINIDKITKKNSAIWNLKEVYYYLVHTYILKNNLVYLVLLKKVNSIAKKKRKKIEMITMMKLYKLTNI